MSGATEEAGQLSAQGRVQDLGYQASFPIILNIDSQPTYFMTLKDDIGLIKQYAFVSVTNYSTVGTGESVSDALRDYESKLVSDGVTTISNLSGETKAAEGVILRIASEYSDGLHHRTNSCWRARRTSCSQRRRRSARSSLSPSRATGSRSAISSLPMELRMPTRLTTSNLH